MRRQDGTVKKAAAGQAAAFAVRITAPTKEELLLTEIRDLLRERQADGR